MTMNSEELIILWPQALLARILGVIYFFSPALFLHLCATHRYTQEEAHKESPQHWVCSSLPPQGWRGD